MQKQGVLNDLDYVELVIQAGEYSNKKEGNALDLGLSGFPLDWVKSSPSEAEDYSDIIGDYRCNCHDEYVCSYGSYEEFSESYQIKIRIRLLEGDLIQSDNFNDQ